MQDVHQNKIFTVTCYIRIYIVFYRLRSKADITTHLKHTKKPAKGRKYPSSRHSYKDELKTYLITFTSPSLAILTMLEG